MVHDRHVGTVGTRWFGAPTDDRPLNWTAGAGNRVVGQFVGSTAAGLGLPAMNRGIKPLLQTDLRAEFVRAVQ